jgi:photosystem II stability/assembly factor-like uncharacterized protein
MRRALSGLALSAAVAAVVVAGGGTAAGSAPRGFHPETAAAFGARDIWLLGGSTLLRSTDAGRHFVRLRLPRDLRHSSIVFANARDGFASAPGALFSTHDGGESWHQSLAGEKLGFGVGGGYAYAVTRAHGLERSLVSRDAWRLILPLKTGYQAGIAAHGTHVWLVGAPWRKYRDTIRMSTNRGRTFTSRTGPCSAELPGSIESPGGGVLWAVCPTGMMASLSVSTNAGRTFARRSFFEPNGHGRPQLTNDGQVALFGPRAAVLDGGYAPLLRTTDNGRHWRRVQQPGQIRAVRFLRAATSRVGIALVQTRESGPLELWRTADAGRSWHTVPVP